MPAKWYAFDFPKQNPLVKFIVLDSNYKNRTVSLTDAEKAQQNAWFKTEISKPRTTPYLIVMAHHPLYSNGVHGDTKHLITDWEPLMKQHRAHFYFCGHDHDMQHMEFEAHPTSFILSGGGAFCMNVPSRLNRAGGAAPSRCPRSPGQPGPRHSQPVPQGYIGRWQQPAQAGRLGARR